MLKIKLLIIKQGGKWSNKKRLTLLTEVSRAMPLTDWCTDLDNEDDEDFEMMHAGGNAADDKFDITVGAL